MQGKDAWRWLSYGDTRPGHSVEPFFLLPKRCILNMFLRISSVVSCVLRVTSDWLRLLWDLRIAKIYPLDAMFDVPDDVPEDIKSNKRRLVIANRTGDSKMGK